MRVRQQSKAGPESWHNMSTKVFVSYAREDLAYKNKILSQLLVLENQGLLSTWSDAKVEPGLEWQEELTRELRSAGIVLLLITANFLNSGFILNTEIAELLESHRKSGLRIIPVLCRPCTWEAVAWLRPLDIWPETRIPLWKQETDDPEQQLSDLAREIARIVGLPMGAPPSIDDDRAWEQKLASLELQYGLGSTGVAEMIRVTILRGAPIYNAGDQAGCAAVYMRLVDLLLPKLAARLDAAAQATSQVKVRKLRRDPMGVGDSGMGRPFPSASEEGGDEPIEKDSRGAAEELAVVRQELVAVRSRLGKGTGQTPAAIKAEAWMLRRTFDRLLKLDVGLQLCSKIAASAGRAAERATLRQPLINLLRVLDEIADGSGLDSDGDYETGAMTAASLGALACRAIERYLAQATSELFSAGQNDEAEERLQRYLRQARLPRSGADAPYRTLYASRLSLRALLVACSTGSE